MALVKWIFMLGIWQRLLIHIPPIFGVACPCSASSSFSVTHLHLVQINVNVLQIHKTQKTDKTAKAKGKIQFICVWPTEFLMSFSVELSVENAQCMWEKGLLRLHRQSREREEEGGERCGRRGCGRCLILRNVQ